MFKIKDWVSQTNIKIHTQGEQSQIMDGVSNFLQHKQSGGQISVPGTLITDKNPHYA